MAKFAKMRFLDVWYSRIDVESMAAIFDALQPKRAARRRRRDIDKARRRTSQQALAKLCALVDGEYTIKPDYPVIVRYPVELDPGVFEELRSAIARTRRRSGRRAGGVSATLRRLRAQSWGWARSGQRRSSFR
jgi:hypothetical protein